MRYHRKQFLVMTIFIYLMISIDILMAQMDLPRPSPKASVSQTIGITDVEITYCRPGVKGRTIWGELVPYDQMWRTGANEATTISFSTNVMIDGYKLGKGKYSFFTIPSNGNWTLVFNKKTGLWGTGGYDKADDALRIEVKPESAEFKERMMFYFTELKDNSARVVLHWEKLKVYFDVEVDVNKLVMEEAKNAISWQIPYRAAGYALEHELDMVQAQKWLRISRTTEKNYWNTSLQAKFLAKEGKKREAVKTMEEALEMGKAMERTPFNFKEMKSLLAEWKSK